MRITRVYTGVGDDGFTRLGDGQRVSKDAARVEAFGSVDELNSFIGHALSGELDDAVRGELRAVQNDLFHVGSELCLPDLPEEESDRARVPRIEERHVARLEACIDALQKDLGPLEEFILPGGCEEASRLHTARGVCRRAERRVVSLSREEKAGPNVVKYLNRLSDALFVMARYENYRRQLPDTYWEKEK